MKWITRTFLQGLLLVLPGVITVFALVWLFGGVERAMRALLDKVGLEAIYFPGLGIIVVLAIILLVGFLAKLYVVRKTVELFEKLVERIPLIKSIYGAVKDLTDFLDSNKDGQAQQVCMIDIKGDGTYLIGLVMQEDLQPVGPMFSAQTIAVYLPMSYQIGGFTIMVDRARVEPIDMSIEDAMRFAMTAGVAKPGAKSPTPGTKSAPAPTPTPIDTPPRDR